MNENSQSEEQQPRPGSARWRHQQRKQRQVQTRRDQQMAARRTDEHRQVSQQADGRFDWLDIEVPVEILRPLAYLAAAAALVLGIIFLLRLFNPPEAVTRPNAIWLGSGWSFDQPSDQQVADLATRLRFHEIGTAHVWVTYLKEDQTWSGKTADRDLQTGTILSTVNPNTGQPYQNELAEMEPNIRRFVRQFDEAYPEGELYGWISFPADVVPLDDPQLHTRVAELATLLVIDYGFDGIYLNIEPVADGNEGFLQLLRTVRLALDDIGTDRRVPIAAAIPPDWRPSDPTIPHGPFITDVFEWSKDYKQNVALLVDEMMVMSYQSGLRRPEDYSTWVAYQTKAYAEAVAELDIGTEVFIGIPTYPAELPGHDPAVENVLTAVRGLESGLVQAGPAADVVSGTTIYAEWTTDTQEWSDFYSSWIAPR